MKRPGDASTYDLLIAGAGPVGCVVARLAADEFGWRSLVVEKRDHVAGNCHDRHHESGVLIHVYGPHFFRTNSQALLDFLSRFTAWVPGKYVVNSKIGSTLYPFPINLTTLERYFDRAFTPDEARRFLEAERVPIAHPTNSEEFVLSRVGRRLFESFYRGYTEKQWGVHPRDLDPSVCGRIPVRMDRDERYVDHRFQVMPAAGFTEMFRRMLDHPAITVRTGADFFECRQEVSPAIATLYTGPVDAYFKGCYGPLPWRSLDFEFRTYDQEFVQPCASINYPNEHAYTRSVEIKHATRQVHPRTVISYETPRATGDPYYPMPMPKSAALYRRYAELAADETRAKRVHFAGRLATYRYLNTDEAIESAFEVFERIKVEAAMAPSRDHIVRSESERRGVPHKKRGGTPALGTPTTSDAARRISPPAEID